MYPSKFAYHRAETVEDAVGLLADHPDAELLAGGHSLIPSMKTGLASPETLVDIGGLDELVGVDARDGAVEIGALTTYATLGESDDVRTAVPFLAEAALEVGDAQVRNCGTIGGNVAHADPASDLPAVVLAGDAELRAVGPDGERTIPAGEFFEGMYTTALAEDELLTHLTFENQGEATTSAYVKKPSPSSGYAMVGVAAVLDIEDGAVTEGRVGAVGALDRAVRLEAVEAKLESEPAEEDVLAEAAQAAAADFEEWEFMEDTQASAAFRANLLRAYTQRALSRAVERHDGGDQ